MASIGIRQLFVLSGLLTSATVIASACSSKDYTVSRPSSDKGGASHFGGRSNGTAGYSGTAGFESGGIDSTVAAAGAGAEPSIAGAGPIGDGTPTPCVVDQDCVNAGLRNARVCDTATRICVECLPGVTECGKGFYCGEKKKCLIGCASNSDCANSGECILADHQCTNCTSAADCPKGTQCDPSTAACTPACGGNLDCPSGWICCSNVCVNPNSDEDNCASCATSCQRDNAVAACREATCAIDSCAYGFYNCNRLASDGCESSLLADANNCGKCDNSCNLPHTTPNCSAGRCTTALCDNGWKDCNSDPTDGCETDTLTDTTHCGSCTGVCSAINGKASCVQGQCSIVCDNPNFDNCDGIPANGCEADLTRSVANCGGCNQICKDSASGTAKCENKRCGVSICTPPLGDCDGNSTTVCEANLQTDPNNCGGCGAACILPHATAVCTNGVCAIAPNGCQDGWADCNGIAKDGCEVNIATTLSDCGGCGVPCAPPNAVGACVAGVCTIAGCQPGTNKVDCNKSVVDGCETDLMTDVKNCGACSKVCGSTNGTASCVGGVCNIVCNPGTDNCDNDVSNGCEVNTTNDVKHCNGCNQGCTPKNGVGACQNSTCVITNCTSPFKDCDTTYANGCESDTTADPANCGACKAACDATNGTATCSASTCGITCSTGWDNCSTTAPGCETNILSTDKANCGGCGKTCGTTCVDGVCATPCTGLCSNPTAFNTYKTYTNLGTAAFCYETTMTINGGNEGNMQGRTLYVNSAAMPYTGNWPTLPARVNGGYCIYGAEGSNSSAWFGVW